MLKRTFLWIVMMFLALSLGGGAIVCADEGDSLKVFFSLGKGLISRSNIPAAKKKAVKDGLYTSLEQALFETLSVDAIAANFDAVTEILSDSPASYIDGYKVVAERGVGSYYHVALETSVSMDRLAERITSLGIVIDGHDTPKLLFLVSERSSEGQVFDYWWGPGMSFTTTISDGILAGAMAQRGFEVLPHRAIIDDASALGTDGLIRHEEAQRIGSTFGADVVVTGRGWIEPSGNVMGEERSFGASIELEGILVSSGRAIGRVRKASTAVGIDSAEVSRRAMTEASLAVGRDLSSIIIEAMKEKKNRTTMIELVVEGTNFFENFTQLSRAMEGVDGVLSVRPRERRMERAVMVINFTGEAKKLAEKLLALSYKGFSIAISEISREHMRVDMVAGGKNTSMH